MTGPLLLSLSGEGCVLPRHPEWRCRVSPSSPRPPPVSLLGRARGGGSCLRKCSRGPTPGTNLAPWGLLGSRLSTLLPLSCPLSDAASRPDCPVAAGLSFVLDLTMWWNDGNGTWFCQAPRKAPRSPAAWPAAPHRTAPLDTSLLWTPQPPPARPPGQPRGRVGVATPLSASPPGKDTGPKGAEKHPEARLRCVSTSTPNGVATPQI